MPDLKKNLKSYFLGQDPKKSCKYLFSVKISKIFITLVKSRFGLPHDNRWRLNVASFGSTINFFVKLSCE